MRSTKLWKTESDDFSGSSRACSPTFSMSTPDFLKKNAAANKHMTFFYHWGGGSGSCGGGGGVGASVFGFLVSSSEI